MERLTDRQLQILILWGRDGLSVKQIAYKLGIKKSAVYGHLHRATERIGAEQPAQAVWMLARMCIDNEQVSILQTEWVNSNG